MVLSTWLVELYLSRCNELEDIIASESVSHDVENLKALRELHEDEMRQFLDTYKVSASCIESDPLGMSFHLE